MSEPYQPYRPDQPADPYAQSRPGDPYGQQQASPYGQGQALGAYGQPYPGVPVDHPQGTLILVLGIGGFFFSLLGPVAWIMGSRALKEIRASGVRPANEQYIAIGRILGIVVTVLMALAAVAVVIALTALGIASSGPQ